MKLANLLARKAYAIILILLACAPQGLLASQVHNVTIVLQEQLSDGPYDIRMTVAIGNQQQQLLLNPSQSLNQLNIVYADNPPAAPGTEKAPSIVSYQGRIENVPHSMGANHHRWRLR